MFAICRCFFLYMTSGLKCIRFSSSWKQILKLKRGRGSGRRELNAMTQKMQRVKTLYIKRFPVPLGVCEMLIQTLSPRMSGFTHQSGRNLKTGNRWCQGGLEDGGILIVTGKSETVTWSPPDLGLILTSGELVNRNMCQWTSKDGGGSSLSHQQSGAWKHPEHPAVGWMDPGPSTVCNAVWLFKGIIGTTGLNNNSWYWSTTVPVLNMAMKGSSMHASCSYYNLWNRLGYYPNFIVTEMNPL